MKRCESLAFGIALRKEYGKAIGLGSVYLAAQ